MCSLYRREHYRTLSHRRLCPFGRAGSNPYVGSPIQLVQCSKDYHTKKYRPQPSELDRSIYTGENGFLPLSPSHSHSLSIPARRYIDGTVQVPSGHIALRVPQSEDAAGGLSVQITLGETAT